jgi:RND family efflux transporter MFP subunit
MLVRSALPVGILVAGWAAYWALSREPERATPPAAAPQVIRTKVTELRWQDYPVLIKTHGIVRPHNEIALNALVSGKVLRISPVFEDGTFFSTGEPLVELDPADYQTAVAVAEARLYGARASLELARVNHERNLEIQRENIVSRAEVELSAANLAQATAEVNTADAQLERARRDLERTRISAPFDGCVRQRSVGLGQLVGPNTVLGVVFAIDYVEVRLPVSGRELPFLDLPESAEDPAVEVELRDAILRESSSVWRGRIIRTEGALDEATLALFAVARVEDAFGRRSGQPPLRVGQPVTGTIRGRTLTRVMALPRGAVRELDRVFLVDPAGLTLYSRTIAPVWSDERHVIVRDPAIAEGALLSTTHLVYAPEGGKVEIIPDIDPSAATLASTNQSAPNASGAAAH